MNVVGRHHSPPRECADEQEAQPCQRNPRHADAQARRGGVHRACLRLRGARRHGRVLAPVGGGGACGREDPGHAGREGRAADRADARRLHRQPQGAGPADPVQEGRALQARGGAASQRLPGGRHLAVRRAQGDAGVRRGQHPRAAEDLHQRRAARLSGGHRAPGSHGAAGRAACALRQRTMTACKRPSFPCSRRWPPTSSARCPSPSSSAARWACPTRAPTARATRVRPMCCAQATRRPRC
mmetsp:Transcript_19994/g.76599  ORF Transcript_19994/g.76599 Transcript_19994/m.76599 type:complete len:241 (-) Transcript_19994:447-1169(-)